MIIGALGDCHFNNKRPERRLDNFWETQICKFEQSLTIFKEHNCEVIVQVGDLFDNPCVSNIVISKIIDILKKYDITLNIIFGNHDVAGRTILTLPNSPLSVLKSSGVINLLNEIPFKINNISIYGANFGQPIPEPIDGSYNVLLVHAMIGSRPLFPGQDLEMPKQFLKKNPKYNLVISGDYHYSFVEEYKERLILNPGVLIRKNISEFELKHEPSVSIINTKNNNVNTIKLKFEPVNEVFDLSIEEKQDNQKLIDFITNLTKKSNSSCNWKTLLCKIMDEMNSNENVRRIVDESIEEVIHGSN